MLFPCIACRDPKSNLCLRWAACANACGTNRGWRRFCFSVAQIYLVLMPESGMTIPPTQVPSLQHTHWHIDRTFYA